MKRYSESGSGAGWERVTAATYWISAQIMTGGWKGVVAALPALMLDGENRGDRYAAVNLQLLANYFLAEVGGRTRRDAEERAAQLQQYWGQPRFDMQRFSGEITRIDCALYLLYLGKAELAWYDSMRFKKAMRRSEVQHMQVLRVRSEYSGPCCAVNLAAAESGKGREKVLKEARRFSRWLSGTDQNYGAGLGALTRAGIASVEGNGMAAQVSLTVAMKYFEGAGMRPAHALCKARMSGKIDGIAWFAEQEIAEPVRLLDALAPGKWPTESRFLSQPAQ